MNTLALAPKHIGYGKPRHGQKSLDIFRKYSSDFLIAERPHLSTECALAFFVDYAVMGTAFWEVRLKDPAYAPVLTLWLASTYGFMFYLSVATSSQGDIFKMKKDQLADLLVPDPGTLAVPKWAECLKEVCSRPLPTYREQFEEAAIGKGVRWEIDQFVRTQLDLGELESMHYKLLAAEPMITRRRL
jgi:hypothetical protein